MNKVINLPKVVLQNWSKDSFDYFGLNKDNVAWISIGDPSESLAKNTILDNDSNITKLKCHFYDITRVEEDILSKKKYEPMSEGDAIEIIEFILQNKDKDIITQCYAGVSRSSAIARFISEYFGHEWLEEGKKFAVPNHFIYNTLCDLAKHVYKLVPKTKINDKRRLI